MRYGASRQILSFDGSFPRLAACRFCACPALPLPAMRFACAVPSCFGCLFACSVLVARTLFSLIFRLFLFGFCRANFFSFVAHAATGIPLLVPSRGFVPGLRVLSPAAFSRAFAPIACFSVLCCSRGFSLLFFSCFFALSCLTSSSQTSFHL